jgi:hypothetical protein
MYTHPDTLNRLAAIHHQELMDEGHHAHTVRPAWIALEFESHRWSHRFGKWTRRLTGRVHFRSAAADT